MDNKEVNQEREEVVADSPLLDSATNIWLLSLASFVPQVTHLPTLWKQYSCSSEESLCPFTHSSLNETCAAFCEKIRSGPNCVWGGTVENLRRHPRIPTSFSIDIAQLQARSNYLPKPTIEPGEPRNSGWLLPVILGRHNSPQSSLSFSP